jgi:prepilin-type N-terminal cleavage/methylation domain-containing protein
MDYKFMHDINFFKKGFTLIELLVVVAIIGLLASIVMASLTSAEGKARYAQALETMHSIEDAAILDYNDYGNYAPDVGPGAPTRFVPKYLSAWPTPPCSGYTYDWEDWNGGATIKVTLRRADVTPIYYYCIDPTTGTCNDGNGTDIKTLASKTLTCSE